MQTITLDVYKQSGFAAYFPYDKDTVECIKLCLGFRWEKARKCWVADGPEVVLDLERFGLPFQASIPARARIEAFREQLRQIMESKLETIDGQYGYQISGSKALILQERGLLGDDMGLGKTKQTLDAMAALRGKFNLAVVLKTLIWNWDAEVAQWYPGWERIVVPDRPVERREVLGELFKRTQQERPLIVIANYEKLQTPEWKLDFNWDTFAFDEAQRVKNKETATHKKVKAVASRTRYVWPMTGTPLETKLEEVHSIFSIIRPALFGQVTRFREQHIEYDDMGRPSGAKNLGTLRERLGPWITRRTKAEVASQLPAKVYTKIMVELTPEERKTYREIAKGVFEWSEEEGKLVGEGDPLAQLLRFSQYTSSPRLLGVPSPTVGSKFESFLEILNGWDGRVLVFSRFRAMAELLMEELRLPERATITGRITDPKERLARVNEFNSGALGKVLVGTDAMAHGLNVTGADLIIHYDNLWNPAQEWQREDRLHRIGQTKTVNVVHMLARQTIDEAMYYVANVQRKDMINKVTGAGSNVDSVDLTRYTTADYRAMIFGEVPK